MPRHRPSRDASAPPRAAGRPPQDLYERRRELYACAAPLFRTFGYRQVTLKALARACGLSIPALYRYFPSKCAFALFPLVGADPGLHRAPVFAAGVDPLIPLRQFVEAAVAEMPHYFLAVALLREMDATEVDLPAMAGQVGTVIEALASLALAAAPALGEVAAREVGRAAIALVIAPAFVELGTTPEQLRQQLRVLLRAYLVPAGTDPARFDALM